MYAKPICRDEIQCAMGLGNESGTQLQAILATSTHSGESLQSAENGH